MEEVMVKTHLIITDIHEEYGIKWCGKIKDTKPEFINGMPTFIIIGGKGRIELNTTDMLRIEKCAKLMTIPRGRGAVSTDTARIFIREVDGNEKLLGILVHDRVKKYAPMFDPVGYK